MPQRTSRLRTAALATATVLAVGAPTAYAALDAGDDPVPAARTTAGRGAPYVGTHLYFGTARSDGRPDVTDRQFREFVTRRVTPKFPDGLTIEDARGQWRDAKGVVIRERSYELTLYYPKSEARGKDAGIEEIRAAYKKQFRQESVMRADEAANVDF
ncbi:DUF3574 domain-containing protein [Streptomyces huiliensis]|uniref:DUF3574 domain-containing protein n=1 Tax=Streptomyces huiliensis TaxID=2876027 RepID=UPI001CC12012|nr:DUF3574 domain-containing protein [Streptomyces huiliensis]MBZ4320649.1 DUF3574 domain-containing protein [Streptomyces huiliensis]